MKHRNGTRRRCQYLSDALDLAQIDLLEANKTVLQPQTGRRRLDHGVEKRHRQARRCRALQFDLFDERNFISPTHDDYPGERLVACRNPAPAKLRAEKRNDLIAATAREPQLECQR
ncbi:MAG: hypothetical protein WAO08_01590 [Hyphomicrobiaceae bacterium]